MRTDLSRHYSAPVDCSHEALALTIVTKTSIYMGDCALIVRAILC